MRPIESLHLSLLALLLATSATGQTWIRNPANGHFYTLTKPLTWDQAKQEAKRLGGQLATIRSSTENTWLFNTFRKPLPKNTYIYIGFSDELKEGTWVWESGEPVTYTNWAPGKPDNAGGKQHYGTMWDGGLWDDDQSNAYQAIVERLPLTPGWVHRPRSIRPTKRIAAAMVYDPQRNRTVLFGGRAPGKLFGDTWEWDGHLWNQVTPKVSPPARSAHVMAYDANRRRIVLFGGGTARGRAADTWEFDGTTWTDVTPANGNPRPNAEAGMTYDSARKRVLLFGGTTGPSTYINETWQWDGKSWTNLKPAKAPPIRAFTPLAYDPRTGTALLFGGTPGSGGYADTWAWGGKTWTERKPARSPSARGGHSLAFDTHLGRAVLFGGVRWPSTFLPAETWEWDGGNWTQITGGLMPAARWGAAMTYDSTRKRVIMFGGASDFSASNVLSDTWEYMPKPQSYSPFGAGCAGALLPTLSAATPPVIGKPFAIDVGNLAPRTTGVLIFGGSDTTWNGTQLPLDLSFLGMKGCKLLASWDFSPGFFHQPGGAWTWKATIPQKAALIGRQFFNQAWVLDPKANSLGIATSRGAKGVVGF